MPRKPYPTDVSDEEWSFAAPYLVLMTQDAPQREHSLREVFNALRWIVRAGSPWRLLPNDFPPWEAVYQQSRHWLEAGCFEAMVMDLRSMTRFASGRQGQPSTAVLDRRTLQSSCESGPRSGYDGYKRKRGSKVHMAVDTLGHLLAVHVTPANEQEHAHVFKLCEAVQTATGHTVELAWADQGYTGEQPRQDAMAYCIELQVVKLAEAKKGFVLLPKRWVVERSFAWTARFRRLAKDYERLPDVLRGLHFLVCAIFILPKKIPLLTATGNA
jgi:transposase